MIWPLPNSITATTKLPNKILVMRFSRFDLFGAEPPAYSLHAILALQS
jgi:hypothetical protein